MLTWRGSTAGLNSGNTYATMTSTVTVSGWFSLGGIRFYAVSARTYTVILDGIPVGSVVSPGGRVEELTFTPKLTLNGVTIQIVPDTAAVVRYASGTTFEYAPGITQGEWAEFPGYRLPWELLISDPYVRSQWEVVGPGYVEGSLPSGRDPNPTTGRSYPRGRR